MEFTVSSMDPAFAIRHRAFIRDLGLTAEDDADPSVRWRPRAAGLAVLRLVDMWVDDGMAPPSTLRATQGMVAELPQASPWRSLLQSVLQQLETPLARAAGAPFVPLFAYGRALDADAEWALAGDVYDVVIEHAPYSGADDLLPDVYHRAGYCARMLGEPQRATAAYAEGRRLAKAQGNEGAELRLRLSEANLMLHLGNLPAAAGALEELMSGADAAGDTQVGASARHDRGLVAYAQGDFERAALLCFAAADAYADPRQRTRALFDVATCAGALGHREVARRVNEIVRASSDSREARWAAAINLLELAILDGRETVFEAYRLELEDVSLPATMAATYHLVSGRGFRRFGRYLLARQAFGRALGVSVAAGINQVTISVDAELAALDVAAPVVQQSDPPPTPAWSKDVERLAESVRRLHREAVVP